ncbi:hydrogenase nickel incorporation protein HypB [Gordonia sp. PP30]|uniref:hydrogenase nickel incorporation protein HypB n=1 Tax=Gordonia sp. PP30 TaxID=2935861 RepID=UPI0020003A0E|nr:hydrogenase nickel incorporation protein HypB [Gordonia sp. PP30]UQE76994.1 hydrogenase nickel incorporation protein HypB [Gordonia sp. PP30]
MGRFHRHDGTESGHTHAHADGSEHSHWHPGEGGHTHSEQLGDHSGYQTGGDRIDVLERIFDENDNAAAGNRSRLDDAGVVAVNLMSSPGAGKTTVLARTLQELAETVRVGVVEGDIETAIDADRLRPFAAQISLLNTGDGFGGECHLDAPMVARALDALDLAALDLLMIENVGNLVCPAEFEVGAHRRAMVFAVTEGEDKPLKYPVMFRSVETVLVNKTDLLPHLDFDIELFERNLRAINPRARTFYVSAKSGDGFDDWLQWLRGDVLAPARSNTAAASTSRR